MAESDEEIKNSNESHEKLIFDLRSEILMLKHKIASLERSDKSKDSLIKNLRKFKDES